MSETRGRGGVSRRTFLRLGAAAAGGTWLALGGACATVRPGPRRDAFDLEEASIADLLAAMADGRASSREITAGYLARIRQLNPILRAVVAVDPEAEAEAAALDRERAEGRLRGPLHGVPILLKDNVDTAGRLPTTAGSLALAGTTRAKDATAAARLRAAGALVLGKANLSEWANFRSFRSSSGWSAVGGQGRNPYVLDRSPCGSSSGSAQAAAANLVAAAVGTETDGSIVCPSAHCGVVGLKPTVGLVSRAGVVPISHSQDTVGPITRTVADAARLLSVMAGPDPADPATAGARAAADYTRFLDPAGLKGARIGVAREIYFGYSPAADAAAEEAIRALATAGAEIVDPADVPTAKAMAGSDAELEVLLYEFKHDLDAYLAALGPEVPVRSLSDLVAFDRSHAERELRWFGQELFLQALDKGPLTDPAYLAALAESHRLSRAEGLDAILDGQRLDALVAPTGAPAWTIDLVNGDHFLGASSSPAAMAGYPLVTVPVGDAFGLPLGLTFMGRAFSEPVLLRLAYALEQTLNARRPPRLLDTVPTDAPATTPPAYAAASHRRPPAL